MIMLQNNPGDYETSARSLQKHRQESKSKQITEAQNVLLASESKLLLLIIKQRKRSVLASVKYKLRPKG